MSNISGEPESFPPNSPDMPNELAVAIYRAEAETDMFGEPTDRSLSLFFCERGMREWIEKGVPFTAAMVSQQLPVTPMRGHLGLIVRSLAQSRQIRRLRPVFTGYPDNEVGRTTCLWVARP